MRQTLRELFPLLLEKKNKLLACLPIIIVYPYVFVLLYYLGTVKHINFIIASHNHALLCYG